MIEAFMEAHIQLDANEFSFMVEKRRATSARFEKKGPDYGLLESTDKKFNQLKDRENKSTLLKNQAGRPTISMIKSTS